MAELLFTLGLMIIGAALFGLLAKQFRQPLIIGYVVVGVLLGPALLGVIPDAEPVVLLSELGLIFLLFIIGLELDFTRIKDIGKTSVMIGLVHVFVMTLLGLGVAVAIGFSIIQGLYLGLLVAISSTIVVAKLMQDKNEASSLHGEIIMGILVVEDILAVLGLALLGTIGSVGPVEHAVGLPTLLGMLSGVGFSLPSGIMFTILALLVQGALFLGCAYAFLKFGATRMYRSALQIHELFFVISVAVVFIISGLAAFFGFSFAIGAFIAGLALSSAAYSHEIMARIQPLKDFFLILFFVGLGMEIVLVDFGNQYALVLFVLIGAMIVKPIELYALTRILGYNIRTSFLTAIHLAQASEFGIILIASGVISGILPLSLLTGAVVATIITMVLSTYLIEYEERMYEYLRPILHKLTRQKNPEEEEIQNIPDHYSPDVVFFGVSPVTSPLVNMMKGKKKILVVDYNPERVHAFEKQGIKSICSDAIDPELYHSVDFSNVEIVVSVIHDTPAVFHGPSSNRFLIRKIRALKKDAAIIVTARDEIEARRFYAAGATLVLTPFFMGQRVLRDLLLTHTPKELDSLSKLYRKEQRHHFPYRSA